MMSTVTAMAGKSRGSYAARNSPSAVPAAAPLPRCVSMAAPFPVILTWSLSRSENNITPGTDSVQEWHYRAGMASDTTQRDARRREFASYEEFWPYYVAMHSKAATRWVHLTGTLTGLAVSAYGALRRRPGLLLALPV